MRRTGDFELTGVDGNVLATASMDDGGVVLDLEVSHCTPEDLRQLAVELDELADAVSEELAEDDAIGDNRLDGVKKVIISRESA